MIAIILLALAPPAPAAPPPAACTSRTSVDRLPGRWVGAFAGVDWTFELTRDGDGWSGRSQTSRTRTWRPLEAVSVADGCVTFSVKSEPRLTFVLAPDAAGTTLSGDLQIAGHATLPFTAKRAS